MKRRMREPLPNRPNAGAYIFVAVLVALSAWVEQKRMASDPRVAKSASSPVQRAPASRADIRESFEIVPTAQQPGAYSVTVAFSLPLVPGLTFEQIIDFYYGVEELNLLGSHLNGKRSSPLNLIATELTRTKTGATTYYVISGWVRGLKTFTQERSRISCNEIRKIGYWKQTCGLDTAFNGSTKYLRDFRQKTECSEKKGIVACEVSVQGDAKAVHVPGFARALFGVQSYTENQAAFKLVENTLYLAYGQIVLLGYPAPLGERVDDAVTEYLAHGPGKAVIRQLVDGFPKSGEGAKAFRH
jgi:hypothetical protein